MRYNIQVKREILVQVEVEANSTEEALSKYERGEVSEEEEIVDSSDIEAPLIDLVEEQT